MRKCNIALLGSFIIAGLVGCGGSGEGSKYDFWRIIQDGSSKEESIQATDYFDSKFKNITNLASIGKKYSDYNGQNTLVVKNIPVEKGTEAVYICMLSNPNTTDINCSIKTPENIIASRRSNFNTKGLFASSNSSQRFKNSKKSSLARFNLDDVPVNIVEHTNEKVKQIVPMYHSYLGNDYQYHAIIRNKCELVYITEHAKFFVDKEDYNGEKEINIENRKIWKYIEVSDNDIIGFAKEFEEKSFPLLKKYFGNGSDIFWWDIDNDKKISILLTPACSVFGGFEFDDNFAVNSRDMICLSTQSLYSNDSNLHQFYKECWSQTVVRNITHECQHLINASAKFERHYPKAKDNPQKYLESTLRDEFYLTASGQESGFNEGLSVFSEFIFQKQSGSKVYPAMGENKGLITDYLGNSFYIPFFIDNRNIPLSQEFGVRNEEYAQKGMFTYYLYEQLGENAINNLCRGDYGIAKYNALDSDRNLAQLFIDFNFAFELETLRNNLVGEKNPYNLVTDSKLKYKDNFNIVYGGIKPKDENNPQGELDLRSWSEYFERNTLSFGDSRPVSIAGNGGIQTFYLRQPKDYADKGFDLTFTAEQPVIVNMIRIQ